MPVTNERLNQLANDPMMCNITAEVQECLRELIKQKIVMEDLSMLIRMMVSKNRRGKLDEEYCQKAMDYLQRKGLQGSVLRALNRNPDGL